MVRSIGRRGTTHLFGGSLIHSTGCIVLLLDEGTSGLDEESKQKVEKSLMGLTDCAIVMVTHEEE
eukprot:CAMPEP_0194243126 /NCGR_PEP_ID=MMETSP0158-20130606/8445_1 /TAXON_ID=33649 /ORGANISM="Thalassionema nitzschioides, Strain L26-B" /LENGTH=64 /DNA_ID=CAMNT_0038978351 /DNA_START=108 /DNA_END=302 /DNA_ORIENTATION=+